MGRPVEVRDLQYILDRSTLDPATGCRNWNGSKDRDGYGNSSWAYGPFMKAHVLVYEIVNGRDSAKGKIVRHSCHNPSCVEITHLEAGTQAENIQQSSSVGRNGKGGVMTEEIVREIRRKYVPKEYGYERLAQEYGVSKACIQNIVGRKTWANVN